jgi:uncharacterized protein (DUF952 family)
MLTSENAESRRDCQCIRAEKNGNMKNSALDATPIFIDNSRCRASIRKPTTVFRRLRILILLFILASVAISTWRAKARVADWHYPLRVAVYPINGDQSKVTQAYISQLQIDVFVPIADFLDNEAKRYDVALRYGKPIDLVLAPEVKTQPPMPPNGGNILHNILWSLQFRYWAYRADNLAGPSAHIRLFVRFFDPATHEVVPNSVGLEQGMMAIANNYASKKFETRNNVVITHELLHTVGAQDKYDPRTNQPLHPHGYAEPDAEKLYPQRWAEIMGGRIPLSPNTAAMPRGLNETLVGDQTAKEIQWIK